MDIPLSVTRGELLVLLTGAAGAVVQSTGFLLLGALSQVPAPVNRLRPQEKALLAASLLPFAFLLAGAFVVVTDPPPWVAFVPQATIAVWLVAAGLLFVPVLAVLRQRKIGWAGPFLTVPGYLGLLGLLLAVAAAARVNETLLFRREMADYAASLSKTASAVRTAARSAQDPVAAGLDQEALRARTELTRIAADDGVPAAILALRKRRSATEDRLAGRTEAGLEPADLPPEEPAGEEAPVRPRRRGSCAQLSPGMTAAQVRRFLGDPDEVRSTADIRGPGSVRWTYRQLACQVHLLDERVEFVD